MTLKRSILVGILVATLAVLPITFFLTLFFCFPIPMVGCMGGVEFIPNALLALVFYVPLGGILIPLASGSIAGFFAYHVSSTNSKKAVVIMIVCSIILELLVAFSFPLIESLLF